MHLLMQLAVGANISFLAIMIIIGDISPLFLRSLWFIYFKTCSVETKAKMKQSFTFIFNGLDTWTWIVFKTFYAIC